LREGIFSKIRHVGGVVSSVGLKTSREGIFSKIRHVGGVVSSVGLKNIA
jgi:hypothetical protein